MYVVDEGVLADDEPILVEGDDVETVEPDGSSGVVRAGECGCECPVQRSAWFAEPGGQGFAECGRVRDVVRGPGDVAVRAEQ